jgi:hypothetical protein
MTTCGLCDTEVRGPYHVHRTDARETIICRTCMDEFRQLTLEPMLSILATEAIVQGRR